ncbi:hypothetical protein P353_07080 [Comamonas testosteroni]|uniref:Uncharacterized protein n=1 Tax=Comamonas testosteroni TaxID=285 RepID=A0A096H0Y4_COMTE|nr:hypothetical protein P353_07080 [Comamonas testosteroni]
MVEGGIADERVGITGTMKAKALLQKKVCQCFFGRPWRKRFEQALIEFW